MTEQTAEPVRKVSLLEAIGIAVELQEHEQFGNAEELYRRILALAPESADAMHYFGVLRHQQGESDEAIALMKQSLELEPQQADWHSNLGIVFQDRSRFDEAVDAYRRAIAIDPTHANAYNNLGVLLRAQGKPVEAEVTYRRAIELNPNHIDAYTNLGILLGGLKRTPEAVVCFCKVITLRPKHPEARRLLALAHSTIGEVDKAVKIYEEWLEEDPEEPIARHMLAACTGRDVPSRASDGFVERVFDNFAASFDSKLAKLGYRAPELVATMLEEPGAEPCKSLDVLDAGCGTGLCGPLVAPYARSIVGVDLSAKMLAQAQERNIYDSLVKSELTAYLRERPETYDLIVSADTLIYFGPLEELFAVGARALRPGGRLVFTLEELTGPACGPDYVLCPHGRYSHMRAYVERVLSAVGLDSEVAGAELRLEAGAPVAGLVVKARKAMKPRMRHA